MRAVLYAEMSLSPSSSSKPKTAAKTAKQISDRKYTGKSGQSFLLLSLYFHVFLTASLPTTQAFTIPTINTHTNMRVYTYPVQHIKKKAVSNQSSKKSMVSSSPYARSNGQRYPTFSYFVGVRRCEV